ncbi:hypothetical protein RSK20926_21275 [Roseobacter sp. SK209-2-6]|nr:hypothetical protein RSK20926_21275 [Roseobacter sp. SK209-2-6]
MDQLGRQVHLAGWQTSAATDGTRGGTGVTVGMTGQSLTQQSLLSGWSTATANPKGQPETQRGFAALGGAEKLSGKTTPTATDAIKGGKDGAFRNGYTERLANIPGGGCGARWSRDKFNTLTAVLVNLSAWDTTESPARLKVSGQKMTGCSAGMESGGQQNPEQSRWLMGSLTDCPHCVGTGDNIWTQLPRLGKHHIAQRTWRPQDLSSQSSRSQIRDRRSSYSVTAPALWAGYLLQDGARRSDR